MSRARFQVFALLFAWLVASTTAQSALPLFKVGDPAPKFDTGKFVQGEPVREFQKGRTYLIEFWATNCERCRSSLKTLDKWQKGYGQKGLVVIAQDCQEQDATQVIPFVTGSGVAADFRVALDELQPVAGGKMEAWLAAAEQNRLPVVFLIDKQGLVAWIGDAQKLDEKYLRQVIDGQYDLAAAAKEYEEARANDKKYRGWLASVNRAVLARKWDTARTSLANARRYAPKEEDDVLDLAAFQILLGRGDYSSAFDLAEEMKEKYKDNAVVQNEVAWQMATEGKTTTKNLALAEIMAARANDLTRQKNPGILDTLARIKFLRGDRDGAVALEQQAVALSQGETRKQLQRTIESYQRGHLPATP